MPRVYEVGGDLIQGCKCSDHQHHGHSQLAEADKRFANAGQAPSFAPSLDLAPIHMEVHMDINFEKSRVTNRVVMTFHDARPVTTQVEAEQKSAGLCVSPTDPFSGVPTTDQVESLGRNSIKLNARGFTDLVVKTVAPPATAQAHVERVTQGDTGAAAETKVSTSVPVRYDYDGKVISLEWHRAFRPNETRAVEIAYVVEAPPTGLVFGPKQKPTWVVSDHETERAQYWLPCVDAPAVRTCLDFFITAPNEKTILANGLPMGETTESEFTKTAHWRLDSAVCPAYLLCIAVGNFVEFDDGEFVDELLKDHPAGNPPKKIKYFGVPLTNGEGATSKRLAQSFRETPAMLKWLSQLLQVPFPFPKYYQFIVQGIGGAMENISLVSWDEVFLLDERLAREFQTYTDMVNIHEMGHSYFGDAVVCRHFDHAWLKEGWATYCEYLWLFDHRGADTALWYMSHEGDSYMDENRSSYNRPIVTNVYNHSWNMYDMHLYPGGAWRLHMLMHRLGRVAFFRGVNMYLRENQGKVVETDTFRHCLERAAGGQNLTEFFQQWIYGYGFPEVTAVRRYADGTLTVDLKQTQNFNENGTRTGHAFSITLEVYAEIESGVWRLQPAVFDASGVASVSFTQLQHAPLQVIIDPFHKVLHKLTFDAGFDSLTRTLLSTAAPSAQTSGALGSSVGSGSSTASGASMQTASVAVSGVQRARAASVLIKQYGLSGIRVVAKALKDEPFWGTRVDIAKALASSTFPEAHAVLAGLVTTEMSDDALQYVLAAAVSATKSEHLTNALRTRYRAQSGQDLGYRAQKNLLMALGNHGDLTDVPDILRAIVTPQYQGIVQSGAITALRTLVLKALDTFLPATVVARKQPEAVANAAEESKQIIANEDILVGDYVAIAKLIQVLDALVRRPPTSSSLASTAFNPSQPQAGHSKAETLVTYLDALLVSLPDMGPQLGSKAATAIRVAAAGSLGAVSSTIKNALGYAPLRTKIETLLGEYVTDPSLADTNSALFTTSVETIARHAGSSRSVALLNSLTAQVSSQQQGWLKKQIDALGQLVSSSSTTSLEGELAKLKERISGIERKASSGASEDTSSASSSSSSKPSKSRRGDSSFKMPSSVIAASTAMLAVAFGFFLGRRK